MVKSFAALALFLAAYSTAHCDEPAFVWQTDYADAYKQARSDGKCLLIWFTNDDGTKAEQKLNETFRDEKFAKSLDNYVGVRVGKSDAVEVNGEKIWLLGHPAFVQMLKSPGLAILDLRDPKSPYYGSLVSVYPFSTNKTIDAKKLSVLLDLPAGSLTQRTLIFAVRTHPEAPKSTQGIFDPLLSSETTKHSTHQASINLQGHHNWSQRFQLISAKLPDRLLAQEVCAESWPGQNLVEAAEECVHSWRQSSGHWSAVSAYQPRYGYDMQRGKNGVWYATGIFGKR